MQFIGSLLHEAAVRGSSEVVATLLESGADVHVKHLVSKFLLSNCILKVVLYQYPSQHLNSY